MSVSTKIRNGIQVIPLTPLHKRLGALLCLGLFSSLALCASPAQIEKLFEQGKNQQALSASNDYLSSNGGDAQARFLNGVALAKTGKTDAAINVFGELARSNPQIPEYANNLAVLYAQKGEYEKARRWLEAAMSTHPAYATAHRNLGDVYTALAAVAYSKALDQQGQAADLGVQLELVPKLYDAPASAGTQIAQAEPQPAPTPQPQPAAQQPQAPVTIVPAPEPKPVPAQPPQRQPEPEPQPQQQPEPAQPEQTASTTAQTQQGILQTVRRWAQAWSDQDIEAYLDSYANNFYPGDDMSYRQWKASRRERVAAPYSINVRIQQPKVQLDADGRARVTFLQDYDADSYSDRVEKTLILERKDAGWRIVREISGPPL